MKIDIHAHIIPENLPSFSQKFGYSGWVRLENSIDLNGKRRSMMLYDDGRIFRKVDDKIYSPEIKIKDMEKTGINMQVLSTVPITFNYWAKGEDNEIVSRYLNDNLARVISRRPDKFIGLGTVPMQNVDLAIKELIRCKSELNMKGLIIGTHVNDLSYDNAVFEPFWKAAEEYRMTLFIHPWDVCVHKNRWSKYLLSYIVGMTSETTAAALQLAFSGVLERHRRLQIILAHAAGSLPYISARANQAYRVYPEEMLAGIRSPDEYLKRSPLVCADTLVHNPKALDLAIDYFGEDSLLLGSDYPFLLGEHSPGLMIEKSCNHYSDDMKQKMFHKNAMRIFDF